MNRIAFRPMPDEGMRLHKRVIITCRRAEVEYTLDLGVDLHDDPEVKLGHRLAVLRSQWAEVSYTTRLAG